MENYSYSADRGEYFLVLGWVLTSLAIVAVVVRLYSRLAVTRSAGSDDFFIAWCLPLTLFGQIGDTIAVHHGLGRHEKFLKTEQISSITKWEYIDLIEAFTALWFLRSSVMLFTLRLMPKSKKWPQRIIYASFFLNFAITIIVTVTYGTKCVPFTAIYKSVPGAKCDAQSIQIATQQLNGILSCIIDIATALIPAFLLWDIKIKRKTKIVLDIIFLLGLVTAGLSIGRAASTNPGEWKKDTTWRIMPPNTFSMVEEKLGIVLACCPALRQYFTYIRRTGTPFRSQKRQPPDADFVGFRQRVKWRDIIWYRNSDSISSGSNTGALPKPTPGAIRDGTNKEEPPIDAKQSPLDAWANKVKRAFGLNTISDSRNMSEKTSNPSAASTTAFSHSRGASATQSQASTEQSKSSAGSARYSPTRNKHERRVSTLESWEYSYIPRDAKPKPLSNRNLPSDSDSDRDIRLHRLSSDDSNARLTDTPNNPSLKPSTPSIWTPSVSYAAPPPPRRPDTQTLQPPPAAARPRSRPNPRNEYGEPSTLSMVPDEAVSPLSSYILPNHVTPSVAYVQHPRVVNIGRLRRGSGERNPWD
ncbi:MAG: hypothetical protein M1828_004188 [Chrysothrix sp. TS-e1954]|nr:MAG: hypothetical protein M1828_004188 [Chrysothrix sp. TS-e1954]